MFRFVLALFISGLISISVFSQTQPSQSVAPRMINGQIRIDGQPAPEGVLVLLDSAPSRDQAPSAPVELARTITDSSGKFAFLHVESMGVAGSKLFAVTAQFAGYRSAFQVVDLTVARNGYVNLDLKRDKSRDAPNVPPGGPGATLAANTPASPKAQEELGKGETLLLKKHDPKSSIDAFKKVLKIDPQYGPAYLLLGTAYMQTQEFPEAESAFEQAVKLQPTSGTAFLGLGAAMNQQQKFSAAITPLQHSLQLQPDSAEAHYEMGRSLWALGKWQEAEPHAQKALQLNNQFPPAHILMGNIYLRHKDGNAATREFEMYLKLDPQGPHALAVQEMLEKLRKALGEK